jgi:hypothetical protein
LSNILPHAEPFAFYLDGAAFGLRPEKWHGIFRTHLEPKLEAATFQHQPHDHVLKEDERRRGAFASVCHYIFANPLRAELVKHPNDRLFSGAVIPGYPTLNLVQEDFWAKFWRIYNQSKHEDAGNIVRPPI